MNHLEGLAHLVRTWDNRCELIAGPEPIQPKEEATPAEPCSHPSAAPALIVSRWHPQFADYLEPGVRTLVCRLIDALDCITYSSCEGHRLNQNPPGFSLCHVGILPRDGDELARLKQILTRVAAAVNSADSRSKVRLAVKSNVLTSEGPDHECIDLVFLAETDCADDYFRDLGPACELFSEVLDYAQRLALSRARP